MTRALAEPAPAPLTRSKARMGVATAAPFGISFTPDDNTVAPLVQRFCKAYPQWRRLAERAGYLVEQGHLYTPPPGTPAAVALVRSQHNPDYSYLLHYTAPDGLTCTCPYFSENVARSQEMISPCKHLLAFSLLAHLEQPLAPLPTPDEVWRRVRTQVQGIVTPLAWHRLFADLHCTSAPTDTELVLCHASPIAVQWLNLPRWYAPLTRLVRRVAGYPLPLLITT